MFVCQCAVLTDRDVLASIANGACTVADVCRDIGAGRGCGRCVSTLRELVCQYCPLTAQNRLEVAGAAR